MTFRSAPWQKWIAAGLLIAATATTGRASDPYCESCCDYNAQWFSPVDFDYDCLPRRKDCGVFFNYNRLFWGMSGERTEIGAPGLVVDSEIMYQEQPLDADVNSPPPQPYAIQNGIQEAPPNAGDFGWGHRYEVGYFKKECGWLISVLDGPAVTSQKAYGFASLPILNNLPVGGQFIKPEYNYDIDGAAVTFEGDPLLQGGSRVFHTGSANQTTSRNGFGSVHVNFITPPDYLLGWRDYYTSPDGIVGAPTDGGPGLIVVGQTLVFDDTLGYRVSDLAVRTGGDGVVDNIDNDTIPGFAVLLADLDGDGVIDDDEIVGSTVDFDDLHSFNIRFDWLFVRNVAETDGIEIMRTFEVDNSHKPVKQQRNYFAIGYGARFFDFQDYFLWDGRGDLLGRAYAETEAKNQIVGPQVRLKWTHRQKRWGLDVDGRFLFGYNITDMKQWGAIGEDLMPGALNRLVHAQPTAFSYGQREDHFSPMAELRVEGSYQITSALALKLGYTGIFADNITRASQIVTYRLPDMGMSDGGNEEVFINGVDFGFEAVY